MNKELYPHGVDSVRVILVIETKTARGSGTPDDPVRQVTEYWSLDGEKLAKRDSRVPRMGYACPTDGILACPTDGILRRCAPQNDRGREE